MKRTPRTQSGGAGVVVFRGADVVDENSGEAVEVVVAARVVVAREAVVVGGGDVVSGAVVVVIDEGVVEVNPVVGDSVVAFPPPRAVVDVPPPPVTSDAIGARVIPTVAFEAVPEMAETDTTGVLLLEVVT